MSILANSNAIESGGYPIQRSLRFRSSASAYLSRTPASAGNRKTWTWSGWIKRGTIGGIQVFFNAYVSASDSFSIYFGNDSISFGSDTGANGTSEVALRRDPSAWYHVVFALDTTQATASDRCKLYVNGSLVALNTLSAPTQNADLTVNTNGVLHKLGGVSSYYFDGYLAEVNFIDGQALTPSSFGQTDPVTGVWQPLKYMGTYGTNGFYLPFSDNTSATTLAYDKSGNGNNWTANNISTTSGATYDSMTDVPTLTSATAANYCVLNRLRGGSLATITAGNLNAAQQSTTYVGALGTIGMTTGKWYWEYTVTSVAQQQGFGVAKEAWSTGLSANSWFYIKDGLKYIEGVDSSYGASYTTGDIISVAFDADAGTVTCYKNNASQGTLATGLTSGPYFPALTLYNTGNSDVNFGQRPFSYTPPTGFKALNTFNLPDPTIKKPNQYMDATLYSGTSASQTVTNAGAFQPDLVWIKSRSAATDHKLTDSVRGVTKALISDTTGAETTDTNGLTAFNSNGFTVGSDSVYNNGTGPATYVGWQWKAGGTSSSNTSGSITSTVSVNTTAGFSIVTYTGTGSAGTIGHGLGVAPKMIIVKSRDQGTTGYTGNWYVYHASNTSAPETDYLLLNTTAATADDTFWNDTAPTSTVFSVGALSGTNDSSDKFVAYCWAEIAGFSKFGSYIGNGAADGVFCYLGFRPKYVLRKRTDSTSNWLAMDSIRGPYNVDTAGLYPNTSDAEDNGPAVDLLSNGFKIRGTGSAENINNATYIYAAFAESPFKFANAR